VEQEGCWSSPSIKKVIILLIDALRFEYTVFNESEPNPQPNQNKLPIIHQLMKEQPDKSFLFRFKADPPTATMQRLKGILTGGLPTFIDIGENFASSEIREDNLVEQLLRQGYRITFIGDDTWEALFPNKFTKSYPYPSFNVKDITNGDIFTVSHLVPEITSKEPWDIIISHFLGVDHVGHRYLLSPFPTLLDTTQTTLLWATNSYK
jgi:phosphatidylinositol glycan class O